MSSFYTVEKEAVAELTEKKSRFIATVRPVENEEEALDFISEMKKKYWDARHNCSAYIVLEEKEDSLPEARSYKIKEKANDDGEPSKTAGSPILEAIKSAELKKTAIVVTRYFGGVLLGTGGLVRAYSGAAALGIEASVRVKMEYLNRIKVVTDYNSFGRLKTFAEGMGAKVLDSEFAENVSTICLCDDAQYGMISSKMNEATAGKCKIELLEKNYFKNQ
jgi:uncharacterized YigZ family protein